MKKIGFLFLSLICASAIGADRISMVQSNDQCRSEATALMERIAEACTNENFSAYALCFTSKKIASSRSKVRSTFATKDLDMRLLDVEILSANDENLEFQVRYLWDEGVGQLIVTSDIRAEKENNQWKVSSEKIIGSKPSNRAVASSSNLPQNQGVQGVVFLKPGDPEWDPDLPKDMPQVAGTGNCRGGKCNRRWVEPEVVFLKPGDPEWDPDLPKDMPQVAGSCRNGSCKKVE